MKVLFIGCVQFSALALKELINMSTHIVGVCTLAESKFNSDHVDLTPIATDAGIPVKICPDVNNSETYAWIRDLEPDIIFCFGWSKLIKKNILQLPPMGVVGFHPAALPSNRGRHPLIWALVLGLTETASTFFFMDTHADSGDILSQIKLSILPTDNASSLYHKVTQVAISQIHDFVPRLSNNTYDRFPQNHELSNTWRKRGVPDGLIDWRMSAFSIHNLIRGLSHPYVGAQFVYQDYLVRVWESEVELGVPSNIEPGKILSVDSSGLLVKAGEGAIRLCKLEPHPTFIAGAYL